MTTTFPRAVRCHVQWVLTSLFFQVAGGVWGAEAGDVAVERGHETMLAAAVGVRDEALALAAPLLEDRAFHFAKVDV